MEIMRGFDRRLRRLEIRKTLGNSTISGVGKKLKLMLGASIEVDNGGGINVNDGGEITTVGGIIVAYAEDGVTPVVAFGTSPFDGTLRGLVAYRQDGSPMLSTETGPSVAAGGFFAVIDRNGRIVLSDDAVSGHGLAAPHLGGAFLSSNDVTTWAKTTSGAFTEIARGYYEVQNPRVQWVIEHGCDGGTTGEIRVKINGSQVGSTQTSPDGVISQWFDTGEDIPSLASVIGGVLPVTLEARTTSGGGNVYARLLLLRGQQS